MPTEPSAASVQHQGDVEALRDGPRYKETAASTGERPRITVWWCDVCGYARLEQSTGRHQTTDPSDPRGRMVSHPLRPVTFEMVRDA